MIYFFVKKKKYITIKTTSKYKKQSINLTNYRGAITKARTFYKTKFSSIFFNGHVSIRDFVHHDHDLQNIKKIDNKLKKDVYRIKGRKTHC